MLWRSIAALLASGLVVVGCSREKSASPAPSPAQSVARPSSSAVLPLEKLGYPVVASQELHCSLFAVVDAGMNPTRAIQLFEQAATPRSGLSASPSAIDDGEPTAPVYLGEVRAAKRSVGGHGELAPVLRISLTGSKELGQGHRVIDLAAKLAKIHVVFLGKDAAPNERLKVLTRELDRVGGPGRPLIVFADPSDELQCSDAARPMFCMTPDITGVEQALQRILRWIDSAQ